MKRLRAEVKRRRQDSVKIPRPSYTLDCFPSNQCWIPRTLNINACPTFNSIPCLLHTCGGYGCLIFHLHGLDEDLGHVAAACEAITERLQVSVIAMDYPGYGVSQDPPSLREVMNDIRTMLSFAIQVMRFEPQNIYISAMRHAVGPAVELASWADMMFHEFDASFGGLILFSPRCFRSPAPNTPTATPPRPSPTRRCSRAPHSPHTQQQHLADGEDHDDNMESIPSAFTISQCVQQIKAVKSPVLIFHNAADEYDGSEAQKLYIAATQSPKKDIRLMDYSKDDPVRVVDNFYKFPNIPHGSITRIPPEIFLKPPELEFFEQEQTLIDRLMLLSRRFLPACFTKVKDTLLPAPLADPYSTSAVIPGSSLHTRQMQQQQQQRKASRRPGAARKAPHTSLSRARHSPASPAAHAHPTHQTAHQPVFPPPASSWRLSGLGLAGLFGTRAGASSSSDVGHTEGRSNLERSLAHHHRTHHDNDSESTSETDSQPSGSDESPRERAAGGGGGLPWYRQKRTVKGADETASQAASYFGGPVGSWLGDVPNDIPDTTFVMRRDNYNYDYNHHPHSISTSTTAATSGWLQAPIIDPPVTLPPPKHTTPDNSTNGSFIKHTASTSTATSSTTSPAAAPMHEATTNRLPSIGEGVGLDGSSGLVQQPCDKCLDGDGDACRRHENGVVWAAGECEGGFFAEGNHAGDLMWGEADGVGVGYGGGDSPWGSAARL
ncbi:unnamed protein product [Vitrella brassicaformis CCMP3155]|uniref:Serine aminopeptidase S33 domain-containing protein n=2 Tax=Vitrella brassicaformis TaxID=1169539 RepID=A0A0G4FG18_VITBC|nr:unnamed protein product [Vitrella brassicaformis CCMP3155]|eukprot:CEM12012.1 unnamed protein product [Vitrella brassicaformis CCMP3155]